METPNNKQNLELATTDRNLTWEKNHTIITKAMARLIRQNERLPTKTEIAEETKLSVRTVYTHLKEFGQEKLVIEDLDHFNFMASKVLGKVMELAMDGNVAASRLSLQIMGIIGKQQVNKEPVKIQESATDLPDR